MIVTGGASGIGVNCVSPSIMATPMTCRAFGMGPEQLEESFEPLIPLKGVVLKTSHVVDALLFLASNDSGFVSGHNLVVDGGFLAN